MEVWRLACWRTAGGALPAVPAYARRKHSPRYPAKPLLSLWLFVQRFAMSNGCPIGGEVVASMSRNRWAWAGRGVPPPSRVGAPGSGPERYSKKLAAIGQQEQKRRCCLDYARADSGVAAGAFVCSAAVGQRGAALRMGGLPDTGAGHESRWPAVEALLGERCG